MKICSGAASLLLGALCAAVSGCGGERPRADVAAAADLGPATPLLPLYRALARRSENPVVALQIGDSHTANGAFTARMRELFAARFGDAGSGPLPPGVPYDWYRPVGVRVSQVGFRRVTSSSGAPGPFGLAGLRQHADGPAEMQIDADEPGQMQAAAVEVLDQPGGGTLDVQADGAAAAWLRTDGAGPRWIEVPPSASGRSLEVRARGDGPVDVLAWRIGGARPGVQYSNFGTVGAMATLMAAWDPAITASELARLRPALIVVAFGTNEGFKDDLDLAAYEQTYLAELRTLRADAPDAALVVTGPPDGERRVARGQTGTACDGSPARTWSVPQNLDPVRSVIRRIASEAGAYYWDWREAMGGPCSMRRFAAAEPPLAHADHVHLKADGYNLTADALFAALMQGYDRYVAAGSR
jgi:lysophospholipase L1-like esterase